MAKGMVREDLQGRQRGGGLLAKEEGNERKGLIVPKGTFHIPFFLRGERLVQ